MKRIIMAGLKQETATFNPVISRYEDFHISRGEDILKRYQGTQTEIAGILEILSSRGDIEVIPTFFGCAISGGSVAEKDLNRLISELIESIRKHAPVEGACIILHGAMAGTYEDDPEGRILSGVRKILGPAPIIASIDLHAIVTDKMLGAADILVPFHTYPHIDQFETGARAARNMLNCLDRSVHPFKARVKLPLLVRGDELLTKTGLFGEAMQICKEIEKSKKGLSAGVILGNPFTDVPDLMSNVIIISEDDPDYARSQAERLAVFMWSNRKRLVARLTNLDEAIRSVESAKGLTVFSDAADATSSGAPGDSNAILKGLIKHGYTGKALIPIVDAPAAKLSFKIGVGSRTEMQLGGTLDPDRHRPVTLPVYVKTLSDGNFSYEDGNREKAGRTAVLISGSYTILATEHPVYVVGRKVFLEHGLDPEEYDLVVVKSPNGFRTYYESIAARILTIDVPGATSPNLQSLPYRNCSRPMFPLDKDTPFRTG